MKNDARLESSEVLSCILDIMKPSGKYVFCYVCEDTSSLISNLKLHGFTKTSVKEVTDNNGTYHEFYAEKPNFEVSILILFIYIW